MPPLVAPESGTIAVEQAFDPAAARREVGRRMQGLTRALTEALSSYTANRLGLARATDVAEACDHALAQLDELGEAVRHLRGAVRGPGVARSQTPPPMSIERERAAS